MTTETITQTKRSTLPLIGALVGAATYVIAFAIGEQLDDSPAEQGTAQWIATGIIVGLLLVGIAIPFALRATKRGEASMATTSLVFGIVALVGMVVFWAGPPFVFGGAAVGLAVARKNLTGSLGRKSAVGLALGAVAFVVAAGLALSGG